MTGSSRQLEEALRLGDLGYAMLPLWGIVRSRKSGQLVCACPDGPRCNRKPGKHPFTRIGSKDATTNPDQIKRWFAEDNTINFGLSTNRIYVVDTDPQHGGHISWDLLECEHGAATRTWRQTTGSLGEHLLFAMPEPPLKNSAGKLGLGVDTRGTGGYIVAAGSLHLSGRRYEWQPGHRPGDVPLAPLPEWIVKALAEPERATASGDDKRRPWAEFFSSVYPEGQRNEVLTRACGHVLRATRGPRKLDGHAAMELLWSWQLAHLKPALSRSEFDRTFISIALRDCGKAITS